MRIKEVVEYSNDSGTIELADGRCSYVSLVNSIFSSGAEFLKFIEEVNALADVLRSKTRKGIKDA